MNAHFFLRRLALSRSIWASVSSLGTWISLRVSASNFRQPLGFFAFRFMLESLSCKDVVQAIVANSVVAVVTAQFVAAAERRPEVQIVQFDFVAASVTGGRAFHLRFPHKSGIVYRAQLPVSDSTPDDARQGTLKPDAVVRLPIVESPRLLAAVACSTVAPFFIGTPIPTPLPP